MPGGLVIGMPHLVSGNEKAALVDGLGIQNLMNDRLDKLGDACYSDITTTAPVRRGHSKPNRAKTGDQEGICLLLG